MGVGHHSSIPGHPGSLFQCERLFAIVLSSFVLSLFVFLLLQSKYDQVKSFDYDSMALHVVHTHHEAWPTRQPPGQSGGTTTHLVCCFSNAFFRYRTY